MVSVASSGRDRADQRLGVASNQKLWEAIQAISVALECEAIDSGDRERAQEGLKTLWDRIKELMQAGKQREALITTAERTEEDRDNSINSLEGTEGTENRDRKVKLMEPATGAPNSTEEAVNEIIKFTPITSNVRINVPQRMSIKRNAEYLQEEIDRLRRKCAEAVMYSERGQETGGGAVGHSARGGREESEAERRTRIENEKLAQAFR